VPFTGNDPPANTFNSSPTLPVVLGPVLFLVVAMCWRSIKTIIVSRRARSASRQP
jgi:hypothetical protein